MDEETLWLSQAQMAKLIQTTVPNINAATIRSYLIVRTKGNRSVSRETRRYRRESPGQGQGVEFTERGCLMRYCEESFALAVFSCFREMAEQLVQ